MGLLSGAVSLLTVAADLYLTGGDGQKNFSAALTVAIAMIVLAYIVIFPGFVALRIREPHLERPFRVPGGLPVAWAISVVATAWSARGDAGTPKLPCGLAGGTKGPSIRFLSSP